LSKTDAKKSRVTAGQKSVSKHKLVGGPWHNLHGCNNGEQPTSRRVEVSQEPRTTKSDYFDRMHTVLCQFPQTLPAPTRPVLVGLCSGGWAGRGGVMATKKGKAAAAGRSGPVSEVRVKESEGARARVCVCIIKSVVCGDVCECVRVCVFWRSEVDGAPRPFHRSSVPPLSPPTHPPRYTAVVRWVATRGRTSGYRKLSLRERVKPHTDCRQCVEQVKRM
jgi:hypothetical protein